MQAHNCQATYTHNEKDRTYQKHQKSYASNFLSIYHNAFLYIVLPIYFSKD